MGVLAERARRLVQEAPVFDAHVDTLQRSLDLGHALGERTPGHLDLVRGREGGLGSVEQFVTAYEEAGGGPVDRAALDWWRVRGTLRWGVICRYQAHRHLSGQTRSVELATIGRRVCETEWDVLDLLEAAL